MPELLRRNKDLMKVAAAAVITAVTTGVSGDMSWATVGTTLGITLLGLLAKFVADAIDFYFTEVTIIK